MIEGISPESRKRWNHRLASALGRIVGPLARWQRALTAGSPDEPPNAEPGPVDGGAPSREALLRVAIDQAGEGVAVLDLDGRLVYANAALRALIPDEFEARMAEGSILELIGDELAEGVRHLVRDARAFRGRLPPIPGIEQPIVDVSFAPVKSPDGTPIAYLGIVRDASREVEGAANLRQSQRLEAMGRLAGDVAHDFNNMLAVIQGYAGILAAQAEGDPELREVSDQIVEASREAVKLTRELLAFGRRQAQKARVVDLNQLVRESQPSLRGLLPADVELVVALAPGRGQVFADPEHVVQILTNLVVNARDGIQGAGRITVRTADLPPVGADAYARVLLAVEDTGQGMDPETTERVFEPFFTAHRRARPGLGLATVHGMVEQAGGTISVASRPGEGSCFTIRLPRTGRSPALKERTGGPPGGLPAGTRVLVVDDQEATRGPIARLLREEGCDVIEASDGVEALERLEGPAWIDLLVTDVMMPRLDGPGLVARVRQHHPDLPVLYTSGFSPERILEEVREDEKSAFLEKPFAIEELLEHAASLLRAQAEVGGSGAC